MKRIRDVRRMYEKEYSSIDTREKRKAVDYFERNPHAY